MEKVIKIYGDLTADTAIKVTDELLQAHKDGVRKIIFLINSTGGSLSVYSQIKNILSITNFEVITVCAAEAFSTAACIFTLGQKRIMLGKKSKLLFHQPSHRFDGKFLDAEVSYKKGKEYYEEIINILMNVARMSKRNIKEKVEKDWFLSADEALNSGIATEIVTKLPRII